MKNLLKYILQKLLGYHQYLYVFAKFKIKTLRNDRKEGDFFHFIDAISESGIILDIGANIGIMTYHLAKKFPQQTIFAIEPMPDNLTILHKIIKRFKLNNVKVLPIAVGNENKILEMVLPVSGKVKLQGLAHVVHDSIKEWNDGYKFKVKAHKLDDKFINESISAIKMDIENFEYFALQGGQKLIKKHKPIIYLELWPNNNRDKCFNLLKEIGYKAYIIDNNQKVLFNPEIHQKQNFIFENET